MKAIHIKLWRDLTRLRAQVATIALVVAIGVAGFVGMFSVHESLKGSRDAFYRDNRLADVFAHVKRAPVHLRERLAALPGVAEVKLEVARVCRRRRPRPRPASAVARPQRRCGLAQRRVAWRGSGGAVPGQHGEGWAGGEGAWRVIQLPFQTRSGYLTLSKTGSRGLNWARRIFHFDSQESSLTGYQPLNAIREL